MPWRRLHVADSDGFPDEHIRPLAAGGADAVLIVGDGRAHGPDELRTSLERRSNVRRAR